MGHEPLVGFPTFEPAVPTVDFASRVGSVTDPCYNDDDKSNKPDPEGTGLATTTRRNYCTGHGSKSVGGYNRIDTCGEF